MKKKTKKTSKEELIWYLNKINPLVKDIVTKCGFNYIDSAFEQESGFNYLRITISHKNLENKITLDDCEVVSRAMENELDKKQIIDIPYFLEVQSPGNISNKETYEFTLKGMDLVVSL